MQEQEIPIRTFLIQSGLVIQSGFLSRSGPLTEPSWRSRLRTGAGQAGEALAVIGSIVAIGFLAAAI
jgi:hypothetical protein